MDENRQSLKYTKILWTLTALVILVIGISRVIGFGLPQHPVYYVASTIEIVLGYLTVRFTKKRIASRLPIRPLLIALISIGVPIALSFSEVGKIWQVGGSYVWYLFSWAMFFVIPMIRNGFGTVQNAEANDDTDLTEYSSKQIFLTILVFVVLFSIPLVITLILVLVNK